MSVLDQVKRKIIDFDPENVQHRAWVCEAIHHQSWGRCPVRFRTQMKDMDTAVKELLLDYYIEKEFG